MRTWIETSLAALSALIGSATLIHPNWIEQMLHIDPDNGSGSLETVLAVSLVLLSATVITRLYLRRPSRY